MDTPPLSQDEQEGNNLCFLIGDREHMIRVFQAEIQLAHQKLGELRKKLTAAARTTPAKEQGDGSQAPTQA